MDQSAGMLSEEVKEKGYVLLCVAQPQGSCKVRVIPEVSSRQEGGRDFLATGARVEWPRNKQHFRAGARRRAAAA